MRATIVGAGVLLAPILGWASDGGDSWPVQEPDLLQVPDATLAAACRRLELEGPGEYCVEWPWSKEDVLGCLQDQSNPKPVDSTLCMNLTTARDHCCKGWHGAGWRDACRDSHTALWCRPRSAADPANPAQQSAGCAMAGVAAGGEECALVLMLLVAAGLAPSRRRVTTTAVALLGLAFAAPARADVATPPPPPACSRYNAEGPGEYCVEQPSTETDMLGCQRDPANPRPPPGVSCGGRDLPRELCCRSWLAAGWWFDCSADAWSGRYALWCRKRQPADPPRPEWTDGEGCAIGRSAAAGSVAGALIVALFVVVGLIRRRG